MLQATPHLVLVPPSGSPEMAEEVPGSNVGAVYRRYAPYVARVAVRLLGDRGDVEDVVQDVFVEAVKGLRGLRDPAAIRGWLAAVTTRVASRRLKMKRFKRWLHLDSAPEYASIEAPGATPEQRALLACAYTVLADLPVEARNAWILRMIEGEQLESVAVICGCSLATVKRRVSAVQARMEEALGHD